MEKQNFEGIEGVCILAGGLPLAFTRRRSHSLFLGITIFGEIPLPLLISHQGVVLQEFSVAV